MTTAIGGEVNQLKKDLLAVAALLNRDGAWTQDEMARDELNCPVPPRSGRARCWCLLGAITRITGGNYGPRYKASLVALCDALNASHHPVSVSNWQDADGRTQAEVVELVKRAAEAAS